MTEENTFLFADIAGFTALTEAHGDEDAADLADRFCRAVRELLPGGRARVVKTIGDAAMVCFARANDAARIGVTIAGEALAGHGFPAVRVGMNTGRAVNREGDYFGAAVNLAARVTGLAAGNEVLLTEATRAAAGELPGHRFVDAGRHSVRNVREPVHIWRVEAADESAPLAIDPVCRMAIDPQRAAGMLRYDGAEHLFCSLACIAAFARDPDTYAPL